jgi:hypothetical protein
MTSAFYTEDTLVQQTTAEYLEQELGWESVYAYNNEDFGPNSLLGRESDREVVLTRTLRTKIDELNPGLPTTAYDDAVRKIVTVSSSQTMAATNREKYELIKDGVQVTFRNAKGERVRQRLRVFDFDIPENNHFLCVRELWVRGDLYRHRADIVGFANGLPLLFMELKNVSKDIRAAYEQNFLDYKDTVPHLFHHNAFVVLANGVDYSADIAVSWYMSQVARNAAPKVRCSAKTRALSPMDLMRTGSAHRLAMARARAASSRPATTSPVSPISIFSMGPPLSLTMTGSPEAWASSTTLPKVSVVEGKTKISADA